MNFSLITYINLQIWIRRWNTNGEHIHIGQPASQTSELFFFPFVHSYYLELEALTKSERCFSCLCFQENIGS